MSKWEFKFTFRDNRMAEGFFDLISKLDELAGYQCRYRARDRVNYTDHYFDTNDLGLESQGIVLRARQIKGKGTSLVFKKQSLGPNQEVVYHRTEPIPIGIKSLEGILKGDLPKEVKNIASVTAGKEGLEPILSLEVKRRVVELKKSGGRVAELNLDHIRARLPGKGEIAAEDYEVELKSDLETFPEADTLREYLQSVFGLIPITRSKLRRMARLIRASHDCIACRKVILDMDPGVDDALAMLLAFRSRELEVLGITVVGGNVPKEQTVKNARAVLSFLKKAQPDFVPPPVAPGESLKEGIVDAANVHGPDGLGGACARYLDDILIPDQKEDAKDLFIKLLGRHEPGTITLVCTGPLTNVAKWIRECPDSVLRLKEIIVMGGAFFQAGNRSQAAEFNIHSDPRSAAEVVEFCRTPLSHSQYHWKEKLPLTFVGLDVTHQVRLRRDIVRDAAKPKNAAYAQFVSDITGNYMDFYYRNEGLNGCYMHDPLTVAYLIDPSLCIAEQYHVEVEDTGRFTSGMTVADHRPTRLYKDKMKEVTWVCYKVDCERFEKFFTDRVLKG